MKNFLRCIAVLGSVSMATAAAGDCTTDDLEDMENASADCALRSYAQSHAFLAGIALSVPTSTMANVRYKQSKLVRTIALKKKAAATKTQ